MSKRKTGKVLEWWPMKSYGFLKDGEDRKEYWFNRESMPTPLDCPVQGDKAEFTVVEKIVGQRAVDIIWIRK